MRALQLEVTAPFDLAVTVRLLQRRPGNPLDRWVDPPGRWERLVDTGAAGPLLLRVAPSAGGLSLRTEGASLAPATRKILAAQVRRSLGLDVDLAPFFRAARRFPGLSPLVRRLAGVRPPRFLSLFEAFVGVVPFQQVSLDAGMSVFARIVERWGTRWEASGQAWFASPAPAAIAAAPAEELRACGLSAAKVRALQHAATAIAGGALREEELESLPTPEARLRLLELPGIGPWSADLLLLRGLGRLDAFPPGDVGVARGLGRLLGPDAPPPERLAEAFAPQQGMLYFLSLLAQLADRGLL